MPQTHRTAINRANADRQADGFWTERRVTLLTKLWNEKRRTRDIAAELGCTRNMVIGKANRIGLRRVSRARRRKICSQVMRERWKANHAAMTAASLPGLAKGREIRWSRYRERQAIRVSRETAGIAP